VTFWKLVRRTLFFHRRTNLSVVAGASIGTAVIVGALVVGDSVRHSLMRLTLDRLGRIEYAMDAGDRFVRADLADEICSFLEVDGASVLKLSGIAVYDGGRRRVNRVQVLGVDRRFWSLWPGSVPFAGIEGERVVLSAALADRLGAGEGDEVLLRVGKLRPFPGEAPLLYDRDVSATLRLTVHAIASDDQFGRFGLASSQLSPLNAFVPLSRLSKAIGVPGRANLLLAAGRSEGKLGKSEMNAALGLSWKADDAGFTFRRGGPLGAIELLSDRIFIDPAVEEVAAEVGEGARGILTYFVNEIACGGKTTPYSFVSAPGEPVVPDGTGDDEIVINKWLAQDLGARRGDRVTLTYFVLGPSRALREESCSFRIKFVVPIDGAAADRDLLPAFPGLADAENCSEWDPGVPIRLERIRDKDEKYWDEYRGTPKAFVTLAAARRMWKNRYGVLTAVRYPSRGQTPVQLSNELMRRLRPASLGLSFFPVREMGMEASAGAVDFGQLFTGLSFFIIAAAVLLTGLLFVFGVESRSADTGVLLAIGYPAWYVRRLMFAEGALLALIGASAGVGLGILYDHAVLEALRSVWRGAVGTTVIRPYFSGRTIAIGAVCGAYAALFPMWLAIRRQVRIPLQELRGGWTAATVSLRKRRPMPPVVLAVFCIGVALIIVAGTSPGRGKEAAETFLVAGAMMLIAGLALCQAFLLGIRRKHHQADVSVFRMGLRNASRNRWRSLATVALLACGVFLVSAVAANRHGPVRDASRRSSGTGGYTVYAESSMPILRRLDTPEGHRAYGLRPRDTAGVEFLHARVRDGEDASCLNLNRVQQPRILGVNTNELARRGSFSFVKTVGDVDSRLLWMSLKQPISKYTIPAVADYNVIVWGLGKKVGDTLSYTDEKGERLNLRLVGGLANSVFQGSVLVCEDLFMERFPSTEGFRVILADAPAGKAEALAAGLENAMSDIGFETASAAARLAAFNRVENTYLSVFLLLGGLGLVLGCAGMGVVVLRNALERRGELALLRAVGFSRRTIQWMMLCENWVLLGLGLGCGLVAAAVAVLPAIASPGGSVPYLYMAVLTALITASGVLWTCLATLLATRGDLIPALRGE